MVTAVLAAGVAFAGPEDPDPHFGTNGEALLGGRETRATLVKVLPDGRLLVAIEAAFGSDDAGDSGAQAGVRRLLGDGRNDPTFGEGDGFLGASEICGTDCRVVGISLAAEGTYVATSRGVYRLTDEGTVDRGFGGNGVGATPLGYPYFAPLSLIAQGNAGVIVAGDTDSRDGGGPIAIYRSSRAARTFTRRMKPNARSCDRKVSGRSKARSSRPRLRNRSRTVSRVRRARSRSTVRTTTA